MKCKFCKREMRKGSFGWFEHCINPDCPYYKKERKRFMVVYKEGENDGV